MVSGATPPGCPPRRRPSGARRRPRGRRPRARPPTRRTRPAASRTGVAGDGRRARATWWCARRSSTGPTDIDVRVRHEAIGHRPRRAARSRSATTPRRTYRLGFDQPRRSRTGAKAVRPTCPGSTPTGSTACRRSTTAAACSTHVGARADAGGPWSSAAATSASRWPRRSSTAGSSVTLRRPRRPSRWAPSTPTWARWSSEAMRGLGIDVPLASDRGSTGSDDAGVGLSTPPTGPIERDLVVLGLGVAPEHARWPSGRPAARRQRRHGHRPPMRVADADGVWAAGDCVRVVPPGVRQSVHIALGTHANKQGRVAGINIGGGYATFPGVVGTAITQGVRPRDRPHRAAGGATPTRPASRSSPHRRVDDPGRLLPRRRRR